LCHLIVPRSVLTQQGPVQENVLKWGWILILLNFDDFGLLGGC
jgi:hypothetical protein